MHIMSTNFAKMLYGNMNVTSQTTHTKYKWPPYATEWNPSMKSFCVRHWVSVQGWPNCSQPPPADKFNPARKIVCAFLSDPNLQAIIKVSTTSFASYFKRLVQNCGQFYLSYWCRKLVWNKSVNRMVWFYCYYCTTIHFNKPFLHRLRLRKSHCIHGRRNLFQSGGAQVHVKQTIENVCGFNWKLWRHKHWNITLLPIRYIKE